MDLIEKLNWRYATKKFDTRKMVSDEDLEVLKEAVRLSVSSYGLQLYEVLIIKDKEIREQLKPVSWNQDQITDASHLFVFCNYTDVKEEYIDNFINQTAREREWDLKRLQGYGDFIKEKLNEKTEHELNSWLKSQTYLALANLLNACAELKIDSCPMEGFESEAYNKILGLDKLGLNASVIAPIGYRDNEDTSIGLPKVRKPKTMLFHEF